MEEHIQSVHFEMKFTMYIPLRKGKDKIPKDLDATKISLQTSLLPNRIIFEGSHMGRVPTMKFEYWNLMGSENFSLGNGEPHEAKHGGASQNTRAVEMDAWCGEGQTTSSSVDSTLSPCAYHYFCQQAVALPGVRWVLIIGGAYSYHGGSHP